MRLNRFFIDFKESQKKILTEDTAFINQAKNVLRLNASDKIILCDGNLNEATAEIINLNNKNAELKILEIHKNQNEPENFVTLYCPILKKENFEWVVQKTIEIGIKEITPVITKRTIKLGLNYERLNKIIKEASEQSGRGVLPKLNETLSFEEAVKKASKEKTVNLFFDVSGQPLKSIHNLFSAFNIFVGPEGGWDEEEIKIAKENGFSFVTLGKTTLRAETAAITSSYIVCNTQ